MPQVATEIFGISGTPTAKQQTVSSEKDKERNDLEILRIWIFLLADVGIWWQIETDSSGSTCSSVSSTLILNLWKIGLLYDLDITGYRIWSKFSWYPAGSSLQQFPKSWDLLNLQWMILSYARTWPFQFLPTDDGKGFHI